MTRYPEFPESAVEHRGKCPECGGFLEWCETMVRAWTVEDVFVSKGDEATVPAGWMVVLMGEDGNDGDGGPEDEWIECVGCRKKWSPNGFAVWSWRGER